MTLRLCFLLLFTSSALIFTGAFAKEQDEGKALLSPGTPCSQVLDTGGWRCDEDGLVLLTPKQALENLWFPLDDTARFADGKVTLEVDIGRHPDFTLLFRADYHRESIEDLSGYGLSFVNGRLAFYRWQRGVARPLCTEEMLTNWKNIKGLIFKITMNGPEIEAGILNAANNKPLHHMSIHDEAFVQGWIGLRVFKKQDQQTRFRLLRAQILKKERTTAAKPELGFGPKRLPIFDAERKMELPVPLQQRSVEWPEDKAGKGKLALVLEAKEWDSLRKMGFSADSVNADLPWLALDPEYRTRRLTELRGNTIKDYESHSYKNPEMIATLMRELTREHPDLAHYEEIGLSTQNRPIPALRLSSAESVAKPKPTILINGGHHGDELMGVESALDVAITLLTGYGQDKIITAILNRFSIWVVPVVNPDGLNVFLELSTFLGRKNARDNDGDGKFGPFDGVDLNRNYPIRWSESKERASRSWPASVNYRGPGAGSEPETQAMMNLANRERFVGSISFHTTSTVILSPYTLDGMRNPEPDIALQLAGRMAKAAPKQANGRYFKVQKNIYPVEGTDQDWLYFTHGTLAFLVEGPVHNPKTAQERARILRQGREVWMEFLRSLTKGNGITVFVKDGEGKPLEAEILVEEQTYFEGERFTSRPGDGRFDRYLPGFKSISLTIKREGYPNLRLPVSLKSGWTEVEAVLLKEEARPPVSQ